MTDQINSEKRYYICTALYFSKFCLDKWVEQFFDFANDLAVKCNISLEKIECGYEHNKKINFKTFSYSDSGLKKLEHFKLNRKIKSLNIYALPEGDGYFKNPQFQLVASDDLHFSRIYIQMHSNIFKKNISGSWCQFFDKIVKQVSAFGIIKYGFLHPIEAIKTPNLYVQGICTDKNTLVELEDSQSWMAHSDLYDMQLRNVYSANYLTEKHINILKPYFHKIRQLIGNKNFIMTSDDNLLLFLPIDLFKYQNFEADVEKLQEQLRLLLISANGLMLPPQRDWNKWKSDNDSKLISKMEIVHNFLYPNYIKNIISKQDDELVIMLSDKFPSMTVGVLSDRKNSNKHEIFIDHDSRIVKTGSGKLLITLYDPSKHPANMAYGENLNYDPAQYSCECGGNQFKIAVGYEYPDDCENRDDISWFALAGKCAKCGKPQIIFEDETA